MKRKQVINSISRVVLICLTAMLYLPSALGQTFSSGSTGANGPFPPIAIPDGTTGISLNLNNGVVTFAPGDTSATLANVPSGGFTNGVLNLTTFNLPANITLTFIPNKSNTPVTILTSGDVTVGGTINLNGQAAVSGAVGNAGGRGGLGGFLGANGKTAARWLHGRNRPRPRWGWW